MAELDQRIQEAKEQLDAHAVEIVKWHFSPETGSPFWLDWAKDANWDPAGESRALTTSTQNFPTLRRMVA
ncbi:MAG: hypothetical protein Ct9H300mP7_1240 [Verrucomicrobiota bacterium]|nr:MAG: hypothetical protein Ct9H300mP7_1240 [Verrucomicrobiota bacterium]